MALTYPSLPGRRRTKIVATIGPASRSPKMLRGLMEAGVDVIRLNFSHGTYEEHGKAIADARRIAKELGRPLAILQDLQGPRLRIGLFGERSVILRQGDPFTLTTRPITGTSRRVSVNYPALPREVHPGNAILLDDGHIRLKVLRATGTEVECEVAAGGHLSGHKGMNLPGVAIKAPPLTQKDKADLAFGLEHGVDLVALSFVRGPKDAQLVRREMAKHKRRVPVIAKIERGEALEAIDGILRAFDGVMVARGDLGVEMGPEKVPLLQKAIIARATALLKPVITATQMLESMVHNPEPTRAEASDVANAIFDGTDAVMLSAETSIGQHPIEAVRYMDRIAAEADRVPPNILPPSFGADDPARAVIHAAHNLAQEVRAQAIVIFTSFGRTAQFMAKYRPNLPAFAFTMEEEVYRRLALSWGITPVQTPFSARTNEMIDFVEGSLVDAKLVAPGDTIIIVGSTPLAARGRTNFLKVHKVERKRA
jgi:pyruvate kinase